MPKDLTLERVKAEVAEGKLGIARDRLHGLLVTYPGDREIRTLLGEVYWKLGYPIEAGRFWFLVENPDEIQQEAIYRFLRDCRYSSTTVFRRLRVRGYPQDLISRLEANGLDALDLEFVAKYQKEAKEEREYPQTSKATEFAVFLGCAALLILMIVGLVTVCRFLF